MNNLPSGTVTFLFTDIEGSTKLWEGHPEAMKAALGIAAWIDQARHETEFVGFDEPYASPPL